MDVLLLYSSAGVECPAAGSKSCCNPKLDLIDIYRSQQAATIGDTVAELGVDRVARMVQL